MFFFLFSSTRNWLLYIYILFPSHEKAQNKKKNREIFIIDQGENKIIISVSKSKEKSLLAEFVDIIRDNITPADFICINNPSIISVCINDANLEDAKIMVLKISNMIQELVMNNFNRFDLEISSNVESLSKTIAFDKQMQTTIKELVEKT